MKNRKKKRLFFLKHLKHACYHMHVILFYLMHELGKMHEHDKVDERKSVAAKVLAVPTVQQTRTQICTIPTMTRTELKGEIRFTDKYYEKKKFC